MKPNDPKTSDAEPQPGIGRLGAAPLLDHNGILTVVSGQEVPYEVTIMPRAEIEQQKGWDDPRLRPPKVDGDSSVAVWLNSLSPSNQLRCLAKEVRQDSQPLKTFRLRCEYAVREAIETRRFVHQGRRCCKEIWCGLVPYLRGVLWSNDPSSPNCADNAGRDRKGQSK